jgi:hypothetical protein
MIEARFSPPMTAMFLAYGLMLFYMVTGQFFKGATAPVHQLYVYMVLAYGVAFHFAYADPLHRPSVAPVTFDSDPIKV